jgi:cell division septum initiation protein DivIVA
MNENSDLLPNLLHEDFEMQMRGYSRRQVDEFVTRRNAEIRDLEQRLARVLDESEQLRGELSTVRQQALVGKPAHQEISERVAQILKLADDEARAQRNKANDDIAKLRVDAQQETERVRTDAREQAERMLTAAQEQAERTIAAARTEADKTRTAARSEVDRLTSETRKKADAAMANAKIQAKRLLDEATARATAIHDGAERRMNLLSTRHTETVRRLEDILSGVQGLVAAETARMSLEEEVAQSVSKALSAAEAADSTETPEHDLAHLAPPTPETVANGTVATGSVAPPANGGDLQPPPVRSGAASRSGIGTEDLVLDRPGFMPDADPAGSGSAIGSAGSVRLPMGRPGGTSGSGTSGGTLPAPPMPPISPMPPMPDRSARLDGPTPEGARRSPLPMPSGSPQPSPPIPGPPIPGPPQPALSQLGSPESGLPQGPSQPGLPQPGLSQPGLSQPGLSQPGLPQPGLPQPGPGRGDGKRHGDGPEPGDGPRQERDTKRDGGRSSIIDPDEPTEGIRLMK